MFPRLYVSPIPKQLKFCYTRFPFYRRRQNTTLSADSMSHSLLFAKQLANNYASGEKHKNWACNHFMETTAWSNWDFISVAYVASVPVRQKSFKKIFRKQAPRKLGQEIKIMIDLTHADWRVINKLANNTGPYLGFFVCGGKLHKPSQGSPVYRQGF